MTAANTHEFGERAPLSEIGSAQPHDGSLQGACHLRLVPPLLGEVPDPPREPGTNLDSRLPLGREGVNELVDKILANAGVERYSGVPAKRHVPPPAPLYELPTPYVDDTEVINRYNREHVTGPLAHDPSRQLPERPLS